MKVVEIERFPEDKTIIGKHVTDPGNFKEIHPGTILTIEGEPVIVYGEINADFKVISSILKKIRYGNGQRVTQYSNDTEVNHSRDINFGYKPKKVVYAQPPGACRLNAEAPLWYNEVVRLGEFLLTKYESFAPKKFEYHKKTVEESVEPQWRIGKTPYTQGVINDRNALGYHYDRDNFKGVWSCMAYFMNGIRGGDLIVPSLRAKLLCADHTYVLFDGCGLMHGVTPIIKTRPSGYRYSIVYYSRKSMVGLKSYEEELTKMKNTEVKKHAKRLENME